MDARFASDFEVELGRQTLLSEQRRTQILAWVLSGLTLIVLAYGLLAHWFGESLPGINWLALTVVLGCGYEWITNRYLTGAVKRGVQPARFRFYLNALIELSVPTILMLILAAHAGSLNAVTGPASYAYFLFIILSALRLDVRLCAFTGLIAAVSYVLVVASHWEQLEATFVGSRWMMRFSFGMRPLLFLIGGLVAAFVCARLRNTLVETMATVRERERVMNLFGQHVSPAVVNQLLAQPTGFVSELREICVLVLDIRNFTTFSEGRVADEVVAYLNTLWTFMVRTVNDHHGIVNKFLGDGFLAVFGAPLSTPDDCANALAAARSILGEVDHLTAAAQLPPTRVGIALHAGQAIVGNVGSVERKEYTVIGDVVNVAFRIEALNKKFDSKLLISAPVAKAARIQGAELVTSTPIRGRQESIELYRLA